MGKWLDDSFVFYASYHDNSVNQWIHIVCVPLLILTGLVMLCFTPNLVDGTVNIKGTLPGVVGQFLPDENVYEMNWAMLIASIYCTYYAVVELPGVAGLLASAMVFSGYVYATFLVATLGAEVWNVALYTHIVCWVAQFAGHGVWEGRSPALLDNLFQAFMMAPLFVLMEVLFMFGYRQDFREKVQRAVDVNVREFKAKKGK
jgi:uncharacterized membrane protein YGL010W